MIALADPPVVVPVKQGRTIEELIESVSASRLTTWLQCRLKFFFRYVSGIKKEPTPALQFGSTVHSVLQQWNLARWRKIVLDTEALKAVFDQAWLAQDEGIDWQDCEEPQEPVQLPVLANATGLMENDATGHPEAKEQPATTVEPPQEENYVLVWSHSQQQYEIETVAMMLRTNIRAHHGNFSMVYIPLEFFDTHEAASEYLNKIHPLQGPKRD